MPPSPSSSLLLLPLRTRRPCTCPRSRPRPRPSLPQFQRATIAATSQCRAFRASAVQYSEAFKRKNHYERLGVEVTASPQEIKKSFYKLSKTHHPDANPSNPTASQTFSLLSESYHILSHPSRRSTYDRDIMRLHRQQPSNAPRSGSYSSTQASAGGRSPSGLSRRRTTFRGPPPSFYRSGGWGAHTEKRQKAHDESTGGNGNGNTTAEQQAYRAAQQDRMRRAREQAGGDAFTRSSFNGDPFGKNVYDEEIPHFDREGHRKTQEREDERRKDRRRQEGGGKRRAMGDDEVEFEPQMSLGGHWLVVSGILVVAIGAPMVYISLTSGRRRRRDGYT